MAGPAAPEIAIAEWSVGREDLADVAAGDRVPGGRPAVAGHDHPVAGDDRQHRGALDQLLTQGLGQLPVTQQLRDGVGRLPTQHLEERAALRVEGLGQPGGELVLARGHARSFAQRARS
jgi:hypothetical protein